MPFNLRQTYLFARLDDDQFQQVTEFSRTIKLNDGQMLFQAGDAADRFFLVTTGQIKLYRLAMNGNEKVIEIISPGHTFAEALMFLESPGFPVNATAMGTTELVTIDNAQFLTMLRGSVDTCFRLMADMSQRLKLLIKEIDDLTLQSATGRVAGFLWGKWDAVGANIELEAPKGVLASRLSVKPETFSRILHNFSEQNLIKVKGGSITVLDPEGLHAHAESAGICGGSLSP
ncbi:transcriptional regulator [Candidatus Endoriftia persephone str. Guaymas]|uniref:Nitric oxide-responding transcriptional regulator Dnr n=3 Tax=Gammaproteobacteria TaxID=1236 RepID=G2FEI6_9GAMM|nr:Crp/Fnr family transcriptional regulator [Candidatus Endoriftia persephone]EGV51771.1 transcriptional regulator Crp/Fnr [endosymbiont of Riftia pachyptila (vent Ph05)]EGW54755.1 nitric oxide -responding transcriptional regulator Dnr [endosymbiont of Tevnia jerichonana (vent Tica)]MBA1333208.1 transcriptional regulator [Candidatus Endoriftia persephone str. Guaymas]USF87276.1 Crp/Fnr family transcriptional regulator [Candidatus Endoriftia persephone]